jgi:tRNA A37 threonylcarbamoyladenosine dehydratase
MDKDHVKPHNLSRHVAYAEHIGESKAVVAAELHAAVMQGATEITPIVADACDFGLGPVAQALTSAMLVIDASTALEYPRAVHLPDQCLRHRIRLVPTDAPALAPPHRKFARRIRFLLHFNTSILI